MPRLRNQGATTYHGSGGRWLPGVEREVDAARAAFLLANFPDTFVAVDPPAPAGPPSTVAGDEPPRVTKPYRPRRK